MTDRVWKRLRAVLDALGAAIGGRGWSVLEDDAIGALGLGSAEPYRRMGLVHEDRPPVGDRTLIRRGVVVWRTVETRRPWYGGGDETTSIRWHWEVDDGGGWIATGTAASLPKAVEGLWPELWRATVDPVELVLDLLRDAGIEQMGAPQTDGSGTVVRWGYTQADGRTPAAWLALRLYPIEVHTDGHQTLEQHPCVQHRTRIRWVRGRLPPALIAADLARVAIKYARDGLEDDADPEMPAADRAPHARPPPLPQPVAVAATSTGSIVDDWIERLRRALASETAGRFNGRKRRMAARAGVALRMPLDGREDVYGQPLNHWGDPEGPPRLAVPLDLLGALWALGLSLREISDVTTGRETSRSTIGERLKAMQADPGGSSRTGAQLVVDRGVEWAQEIAAGGSIGGEDRASRAMQQHRRNKRPTPDAGGAPRTRVRVKRRGGPTLLEQLGAGEDADSLDALAEKKGSLLTTVSDRSRLFLELLEARGTLSIMEAMDLMGMVSPKAMGGVTGQICRWAPIRGVAVPYEASMVEGVRTWRWLGWRVDGN